MATDKWEIITKLPDVVRDYWKLIVMIIITFSGISTGGWHYFDKQDVTSENVVLKKQIEEMKPYYNPPKKSTVEKTNSKVKPRIIVINKDCNGKVKKDVEDINKKIINIDDVINKYHN